MRNDGRLLVIGGTKVQEAVCRALPQCRVVRADHPLAGLWEMGRDRFDGVLLSVSNGHATQASAIRNLRELAPQARIVLCCAPADEPAAREAVRGGADDYLLEPLTRDEIETAFEIPTARAARLDEPAVGPSPHEIASLGEIMKRLADGPQATLQRLVALIREAFDAEAALMQYQDITVSDGTLDKPVVEEAILRQDDRVGRVVLGPRRRGHYAGGEIARLGDYARLIDAIVQQSADREHWRRLAWTDDLSGLRNRRYFEKSLGELVREGATRRMRLTLFLFDIDDFKTYNDRYGHAAGDGLIREIGALLRHCSRERDVVARYGGDEFAVIIWDAEPPRVAGSQHPSDPLQLCERFCEAIRTHNFACLGKAAPGPVTISGGIASFPWDGRTAEELMASADRALIETKRRGKNGITLAGQCGAEGASDGPADSAEAHESTS